MKKAQKAYEKMVGKRDERMGREKAPKNLAWAPDGLIRPWWHGRVGLLVF